MAQAISQRLLERALGPVDLSYAYQKIDAVSRQLAAEDRFRKQEAAKQYYTEMSLIDTNKVGTRAIDQPLITDNYNKFKELKKTLTKNPNLITRNPEEYGRLTTEANMIQNKLFSLIGYSKEIGKQEIKDYEDILNPKNIDIYDENAGANYQQFVKNQPVDFIIANESNDKTKYYRTDIDNKNFYSNFNKAVPSQGLEKYSFNDKDASGKNRLVKIDKMPDEVKIGNLFSEVIQVQREPLKLSNQELKKSVLSGDYDKVVKEYGDFYTSTNPNGYLKYDKDPSKMLNFDESQNSFDLFRNYLTAKEFLGRLPTPVYEDVRLGELEKMRLSSSMALSRSLTLKNLDDTKDVDYNDAFSLIKNNKNIKAGVAVDRFDTTTQNVILKEIEGVSGITDLSNRDVYLKEDAKTGEITALSMRKFEKPNGKGVMTLYSKGQELGKFSESGINVAASAPLGVAAKKAAAEAAKKGTTKPQIKTEAQRRGL